MFQIKFKKERNVSCLQESCTLHANHIHATTQRKEWDIVRILKQFDLKLIKRHYFKASFDISHSRSLSLSLDSVCVCRRGPLF